MIHVFEWQKTSLAACKRWLVLGKGPTFGLRHRFDLCSFVTIGLNHTVAFQPVDIAHAIDIDVVDDCAGVLDSNAKWLLMPLHPHVRCRSSGLTLVDFIPTLPILEHFDKSGRLLWYDLSTGPLVSSRPVAKGTFSASVVIDLLGRLGVREVRTLGVDGGASYDHQFDSRTLLLNGHSSFNIQFKEMAKAAEGYQMSVAKLVEPIRVFVGCDDSQLVAGKVLEYSIKKHTAHPVEVFFMNNMPVPPPKHKKNRPGTGFSFNRFLIPKLAGYRGKAIYIDADMLVFDDIEKLWNLPLNGKKVLCSTQEMIPKGWEEGRNNDLGEGRYWTPGRQMSVMLLDCEQLDWDIDEIIAGLDADRYSYKDLMAKFCILPESDIGDTIPNTWNCLEWYEEGKSQLVHFTVVPTQPWKNNRNALVELWTNAFKEAVGAGAVPLELVRQSVQRKLIKPELLTIAEDVFASAEESRPKDIGGEAIDESTRLRRMLWDSMISDYTYRQQAARMRSSVGWNLEYWLARKPGSFCIRAVRYGARRLKHLARNGK